MDFIVGQRWVSQAEPQMGLGIVAETDGRHVTIHYPAIEEDRIYASSTAPLARISYQIGDEITDAEQNKRVVKAVEEMNGLLYYLVGTGGDSEQILPEPQLSAQISLASPSQRLFSGQFDKNRLFQMRAATLHYRHVQQKSPARGLLGSRTSLLPHQVYIAHQIANRYAPRVLLADEVGLGKTIEAGMIMHHQLQTGMSSRCLIVVPEPLLHQWLVEMMRKFNLHFSLFDSERYNELIEAGEANPFETEQLILCSMNMLEQDEQAAAHAAQGNWDLAIIDEAHHLEWRADTEPSDAYNIAESLALNSNGLLLLTATPEQVGIDSHFARLRLLDPTRYSNLERFKEEQQNFVVLNNIVKSISNGMPCDSNDIAEISDLLDEDTLSTISNTESIDAEARSDLIQKLLDCHGTGRVLLRNTRAAIENFPQRKPLPYPLQPAENYPCRGLQPELLANAASIDWIALDPRVKWLEEFLSKLKREKILLICANPNTALALEKHLHLDIGIRSTAFHEGLSIVERDRAAAYFSDEESGAQVMICSEIGSEGRNFQFAHHLVLFDLPTNPDLLEQRIGRLDRIGQTEDIKIHIPYLKDTAQENLYRWYHEGLNAFGQSFSAAHAIFEEFEQSLSPWLLEDIETNSEAFDALLAATATRRDALKSELEQGRDHLLELNSCDQAQANEIITSILDAEKSSVCEEFMGLLFDNYGVEQEYHSPDCWVIRPTEQMLSEEFPHLRDEGLTVTFDREKALAREDMSFLTWEHPLVADAMDMVVSSETGNSSIGAIKLKALPPGTVLLEVFFSMQCTAPKHLHLDRYLPATPIRVLLESSGKDLTTILKHTQINQLRQHLKRSSRFAIIQKVKPQLEKMIEKTEKIAAQKAQPLIAEARSQMEKSLGNELDRLKYLKTKNASIRDEEILFFENRIQLANEYFDAATPEMQGLRVIVNTYEAH